MQNFFIRLIQHTGAKTCNGIFYRSLHRSLSGSGQTISQTTRDRLKSMIALKKNRNRSENSGGTSSQTNISSNWMQNTVPSSSSGNFQSCFFILSLCPKFFPFYIRYFISCHSSLKGKS